MEERTRKCLSLLELSKEKDKRNRWYLDKWGRKKPKRIYRVVPAFGDQVKFKCTYREEKIISWIFCLHFSGRWGTGVVSAGHTARKQCDESCGQTTVQGFHRILLTVFRAYTFEDVWLYWHKLVLAWKCKAVLLHQGFIYPGPSASEFACVLESFLGDSDTHFGIRATDIKKGLRICLYKRLSHNHFLS